TRPHRSIHDVMKETSVEHPLEGDIVERRARIWPSATDNGAVLNSK
ncbi:hypothetical protein NPIL_57271, partial [Nephila pilipes]